MKSALIVGISGQGGSYLAEILLHKGYEVHGLIRRSSSFNTERIDHIFDRLNLHYGDLADGGGLNRLILDIDPTEVYNLGAQSHVRVSFDIPEYTADIGGLGTLRLLEAIRNNDPGTKFYQAGSSEMFGSSNKPQNESSPFSPESPYGCAKAFAYWTAVNYRKAYKMFICNGILFNHESPRRGKTFVTRKTTQAIAAILAGKQEMVHLGNLDARRDWGYAPEYMGAVWKMMQQDKPDDYVLATEETHFVREFVEEAFRCAGMDLKWYGYGKDERGIDLSGKTRVVVDERFFRPSDVDCLLGDASKARKELDWQPRVRFKELVKTMVEADCK